MEGIDISATAVRRARERARAAGLSKKCRFRVGNAYRLRFEPGSFDFVLDRGCFHHIPFEHRKEYVEGIARVTRPGGIMLVMAFSKKNPWGNTFSRKEIAGHFSPYFRVVSAKETVHVEPDSGGRVYMHALVLRRSAERKREARLP